MHWSEAEAVAIAAEQNSMMLVANEKLDLKYRLTTCVSSGWAGYRMCCWALY